MDGQLLILRSTVFPGVTALVERMMSDHGLDIAVSFCPERIAEGQAMTELSRPPADRVGPRPGQHRDRAAALFRRLTDRIVELEPEEAELAKLFTNTWRYIKFAAANQFFMIADNHGLDFERIRVGLSQDYPRAADMPSRRVSRLGRACSRTRCSWRPSTTTTSRSDTRRCSSTRACRCMS